MQKVESADTGRKKPGGKARVFYELARQGVSIEDIAEAYGHSIRVVRAGIWEYRSRYALPRLVIVSRKAPSKPKAPTVAKHGAKFHRMHCGGGMTAEAIAQRENLCADAVRRVLQAYRQEMWGGG